MQKLWTGEGTAEVWTKERHSKGSCSREEKLLVAKWPRAVQCRHCRGWRRNSEVERGRAFIWWEESTGRLNETLETKCLNCAIEFSLYNVQWRDMKLLHAGRDCHLEPYMMGSGRELIFHSLVEAVWWWTHRNHLAFKSRLCILLTFKRLCQTQCLLIPHWIVLNLASLTSLKEV